MKYLHDIKLFACLVFAVVLPFIIETKTENSDNFYLLLFLEVSLISYGFWRATRISSLSIDGEDILAEILKKKYIWGGVYKVTLSYTYEGQSYTKTLDVDESVFGNNNFLNIKVNKDNPKDFLVIKRDEKRELSNKEVN